MATPTMPFTDLQAQYRNIKADLEARIQAVLDHGHYILGPEVTELERTLATFAGSKHGIACSSGTDALLVALMALGVKKGDVVLTTPFTFFATAEVIALLEAIPVFVDVQPATFNLDPAALERALRAVTHGDSSVYPLPRAVDVAGRKPRGVIAVDLFGLPADYDSLAPLCRDSGAFLLEDAAQSFGAEFRGRKACSFGEMAATSFFPAKPLGCYGDGGMVFTDDDDVAAVVRSLIMHGKGTDKYDNVRIGLNGRLDTLQAAILLSKFSVFGQEATERQKRAECYSRLITEACGAQVLVPEQPPGSLSILAQYTIRLRQRSNLGVQHELQKRGIPSAIYYPRPLHLQTAFHYLGYQPGDFPVSEELSREVISLPFSPYIGPAQQEAVVRALVDALAATARHSAST
jgi:UDP-2-acetamido-2-deoxy-ribo-hexuluronate aminotransferase